MNASSRAAMLAGALVLSCTASAQAAQDRAPGQLIVKYVPGSEVQARDAARDRAGVLDFLRPMPEVNASVVSVAKGSERTAADALERSSTVLYAEPNYVYRTLATPNDPLYAQQDDLHNTGQQGGSADVDIDAMEGWDLAGLGTFAQTGGAKIGIVDTGIAQTHEDLVGRASDCAGVKSFGVNLLVLSVLGDATIVDGRCEDDNKHGTHVAGTIAANTNNAKGIAGIAFNSPLAVCKALSSSGAGTLEMVANCITWLNQKGAKVISMSLGAPQAAATLLTAVQSATSNGSLIVVAAGNGGDATPNFPAAYPDVVSVAATDGTDAKAPFSTFNPDVEVSAPGVKTLSTVPGGYERLSGTSMATPHVAAIAGLIKSRNPQLTVAQLREKLDASVDDLGPAGRDPSFGFGRISLRKAMQG